MNPEPGSQVQSICEALGFAGVGIVEASPSRWADEFRRWLDAGRNGSMEYLSRHVEERLDPSRILPGARSVIMVADLYAARGATDRPRDRVQGKIARYARGRDYHVVMKKRLHALCDRLRETWPEAQFRAFVDTAPVLEREHAARAGLGWIGKHTLLIHPKRGSWMLLGGVLTTLELPASGEGVPDHCGTCTRCIDACPTRAISPYSVDASRCISYLTIERRLRISPEFHEPIGEWIFGCDICQEVCPHNSARPGSPGPNPAYNARREGFDIREVLGWTEADRRMAFTGSALKRATLAMMKRNAIIIAGNLLAREPDQDLLDRVRMVSVDEAEPEMVRASAREVLKRFDPAPG